MFIRKSLPYVPLLLFLTIVASQKITSGTENPYKYTIQKERFNKSSLHRFQVGLSQTIHGLEQKSDDLEAMNQNLEGRINMLAAEKDKLNKAYTQIKARQSTLEKEHTQLKKKATSLEVAYKKLASKSNVAARSQKPKPVAKKTSPAKVTQKKTGTKPKNVASNTMSRKVSTTKKVETTSSLQSHPQKVSESIVYEEQKDKTANGLDIKKINEKGIEYGKKGMYEEAIKEFRKVVAIEPNMANAHYNLGLAYKKRGMIEEANKEFAEYERLSKQNN